MPKQDKSKAKGSPFTAYALQGRSLDQPLGTKLPALPGCQSTLYRGTLCEKLTVPSSGFTLTDPHGHLLKSHYNSLYDPNLRQYYYRKDMLERLKKGGFITENNKVICSLKDFNEYRQYLMSVKLDYERNHKKEQTALIRRLQEPDVLPEGVCLEDVREWLLEEGRKSLWQQDRSWRKKDLAEVQERQARQVRDRARSRAEEEDQKEVEPCPSLGRCGSPQEEADRYRELEWKLKERALLERIEEDVKSEVSRQQLLREAVDGRARKRQELFEKKVALHEQMLREVISEREEFEKSIAGRFEKQKIISEINPNLKPAPPKSAKPEVVRAAPRGRNWTRLCRGQRAGCPKDRCTSRPPSSPPPRPDEAPAHLRQAGEKIGHSRTTVVTRKDEEVTDSREASFLHISTSVTSESSSVSEGGLNAGSVRQPSVVHQLSDTHGGIEETLYGTKSLMPEAGEEVSADDSLLARSEAGGAGGAGVMENGALLCLKEILGSSRSCIMAKVESVVSQALEQAVTLGSDARSEAEQEAMLASPGRVISHPKANVLSSEIVDTVIDHVNSALLRDRLTESARGLVRSSLTSLASAQDADSFDPSDSRAISDVSEKLDPFLSDVGESACKLLGGQRDGLQPVASSEGEAEDMESALGDFAAEIISVILNGVKSESGRGAAPDSPWRFRIGSLKANQVTINIVSAVLDNLESTLLAKNIHLICPPKTERSDPISAECEHWPNESVQSGDTGECVLVRSETERLQEEADCFAEQPPAGFEPSAAVTTYSPLKDFLLPVQIVSNPETQHPGTWVSTSNLDLITTDLVRVLCAMGPTDATVPHISHASVAEAELSSPGSEGNTFEPICVPVRERSSLETAAWRKSSEHKDPTVASGVTRGILGLSRHNIIEQAEHVVVDIIKSAIDQLTPAGPGFPTTAKSPSQARINTSLSNSLAQQPMLSAVASDVVDTVICKVEQALSSTESNLFQGDASIKDSESGGVQHQSTVWKTPSEVAFAASHINTLCDDITMSVVEKLQDLMPCQTEPLSYSSSQASTSASSLTAGEPDTVAQGSQQQESGINTYAKKIVSAILCTVKGELEGKEQELAETSLSGFQKEELTLNSFAKKVVGAILDTVQNEKDSQALHKTANNCSEEWILYSEMASSVLDNLEFVECDGGTSGTKLSATGSHSSVLTLTCLKKSSDLAASKNEFRETQNILKPSRSTIIRQAEQAVLEIIEKAVDQLILSIPTVPTMTTSSSQTRISMKSPSDSLLSLVASDVVDTVLGKIESSTSSSATSLKDSDSAGQLPSPAVRTVESNTVFTPSKIYMIATDIVRSVTEKLQQLKSLSIQTFSESSPESLSSVSSVVRDGLPSAPVDTQQTETELKSYAKEAVSAVLLTVQRELDREIPQGKTGVSPSAESLLVSQVVSSVLEQITNRTSDDNIAKPGDVQKSFEPLSIPVLEKKVCFQGAVSKQSSEGIIPTLMLGESRDILGLSGSVIIKQAKGIVLEIIERAVDQLHLSRSVPLGVAECSSQTGIKMKSPSDSLLSLVASDVVDTVLRTIESASCTPGVLSCGDVSIVDFETVGTCPNPSVCVTDSDLLIEDLVTSVMDKLKPLANSGKRAVSGPPLRDSTSLNSLMPQSLPSLPLTDIQEVEFALNSFAKEVVSSVLEVVKDELDGENLLKLSPSGPVTNSEETLLVCEIVSSVLEQLKHLEDIPGCAVPHTENTVEKTEANSHPLRSADSGVELTKLQTCNDQSSSKVSSESEFKTATIKSVCGIMERVAAKFQPPRSDHHAVESCSSALREVSDVQKHACESWSSACLPSAASDVVEAVLGKLVEVAGSEEVSDERSLGQDRCAQEPSTTLARKVDSGTWVEPSQIQGVTEELVDTVMGKLKVFLGMKSSSESQQLPAQMCGSGELKGDSFPLSGGVSVCETKSEVKSSGLSRCVQDVVSQVLHMIKTEIDGENEARASQETLLAKKVVDYFLCKVTAPKLEKLDSEKTVIITEEPCRVTSTHVEKEDLEMPDEIPVQPCDPVNVPGMVIYSQSDSTDETPTVSSRRAACSSSSKTPAPASEKEEDLFKGPGSRCTMGIRPRCRKKSLAPKDLGLSGNEPDFVSEGVTPKRNLMEKLFRGKRFTAKEQLAGETIRSSARAADPSGPTSAVRLPTGRGTAPPAGSTAPENGLAVGTVADAADSLARTRRRGIPAQLPEKTFLAPMSVSSATCSTVGSSLGQDPAMAARERRVKKLPKIAPQAVEKGLQQHPGQFEGFPAVVPVPPTCPRDKPPPHRRLLRVKMFPAQRFQ
nr:PREDICTED: uncharacterized protein LOC107077005 isoform X3 [Lepisosteus oculatus]